MEETSVLSKEMQRSIIERDEYLNTIISKMNESIAPYLNSVEAGLAPEFSNISKIYATVGNAKALMSLTGAYQDCSNAIKAGESQIEEASQLYKSASVKFNETAKELIAYNYDFKHQGLEINLMMIKSIQSVIEVTKESARKCLEKSLHIKNAI